MLNSDRYKNILEEDFACNCSFAPALFKPFKKNKNTCLFKNKREVKYRTGETIFKQDTNLTHVACIKSGIVKQYIEGENGKSIIYNLLKKGDIIGFSEILTDNPINFSVTAITETEVCLIPVDNALETMEENSSLALDILKYNNVNNQQIIRTFVSLNQKNMYQKVAEILLYFSNIIYQSEEFNLPICRQDLADMCSMTKESFIRVLKELKESDYVSVKGNEVKILNMPALERLNR